MPIDPGFGERLARRVSQLFEDAELGLLHRIAKVLADGIDETPTWAADKLLKLESLRYWLRRDIADLTIAATKAITDVITEALHIGQERAAKDLSALRMQVIVPPATAHAVTLIAADTTRTLTPLPMRLLRAADDMYRRVVADASASVLLGAQTRRQAAQQVIDRLAAQGMGGIIDKRGRRWQAASYAEMAVRTGAGNAAVMGHTQTLQASGQDFVIVSDAPRECPKCRPWEGQILSISGAHRGAVEVESATTGEPMTIRVAGSVDDAKAAGFQHPNCRHSLGLYLPGATRTPAPVSEPDGYEAQQRQRAIERRIRHWKTQQAAALDDAETKARGAKVREWQGHLRDHLAANPDLKRQRQREQITGAR